MRKLRIAMAIATAAALLGGCGSKFHDAVAPHYIKYCENPAAYVLASPDRSPPATLTCPPAG
jgi:hypothetical protein